MQTFRQEHGDAFGRLSIPGLAISRYEIPESDAAQRMLTVFWKDASLLGSRETCSQVLCDGGNQPLEHEWHRASRRKGCQSCMPAFPNIALVLLQMEVNPDNHR